MELGLAFACQDDRNDFLENASGGRFTQSTFWAHARITRTRKPSSGRETPSSNSVHCLQGFRVLVLAQNLACVSAFEGGYTIRTTLRAPSSTSEVQALLCPVQSPSQLIFAPLYRARNLKRILTGKSDTACAHFTFEDRTETQIRSKRERIRPLTLEAEMRPQDGNLPAAFSKAQPKVVDLPLCA